LYTNAVSRVIFFTKKCAPLLKNPSKESFALAAETLRISPWSGIILLVSDYNGKIYLAKFRPQAPHAEYTVVEFWRQDRDHTTNTTFAMSAFIFRKTCGNSQHIAIND
jgi:hypothetical protein